MLSILTHPTRALLAAASRGETATLSAALDSHPAIVDQPGPHPFWGGELTLLHIAAEWGQLDTVRFLLARGASPNPDSALYDHWTPLLIAIHRNHQPVVELLLANGATLTLCAAAALGRDADVARLLAAPNTHEPEPNHADSPGRDTDAARHLAAPNANEPAPDQPAPPGRDTDAARLLAAPNANEPAPNHASPLHFAATVPVARRLLAAGASHEALDKYGRNPGANLATYGPRFRESALFLTRLAGDMDLNRAIALGDLDAVRQLYQPMPSALATAARHGYTDLVAFLLAQGADPNAGCALHHAAASGHLDAARLLLQHGADPNLADPDHRATALDWARFHRQPALAALLADWLH